MTKKLLCLLVALHSFFAVFGQSSDPVILSYQRNFVRASISTKLELLNDASRITTVNMTPLYIDALAFANAYYPLLGSDSQLMDLAAIAAAKAASYQDISVLPQMRTVFSSIPETRVRVACLNTFAVLMKGQKDDIAFLNGWFGEAINNATKGSIPDIRIMTACAQALGKIADGASFPVLFKAATSTMDTSIIQAATASLNGISDGYTDNILAIIAAKRLKDTYAAFSFAMKKESLPAGDKGAIAEAAFKSVTENQTASPDANPALQANVIRESMEQLTSLKWAQASPMIVKYFYQIQGDYKNDKANLDVLIPVINCMGAMGTSDAAQALSIFLGLLNSDTEQKNTYNEQLMLAVILALGDLGDKTAFDYLLYVGYLNYPETVKKASRDALARLQW